MAKLFKCCFCQRVDSNFSNFEKKGNLIFCKKNCNKTERQSHEPVSEFENADGDSVGQAFPRLVTNDRFTVEQSDHNTSATEVANSTMIDQVMEVSLEVTNANDSSQPVKGKDKQDKNKCGNCAKPNCTKWCALCKGTFYCSKECQRKDWSAHKEICVQRLTEEEQEIYKIYVEKTRQRKDYRRRCREFTEETDGLNNIIIDDSEDSFDSSPDRMYLTLPLKQALIIAPRPVGSLDRALCLTRILFPLHDIIIELDDFPFFPSLMQPCRFVLLAFIYRFHDDVMRHGVYIKDARDNRCKVEFDLDHIGDDPAPHFSYSQVEPGAYICLLNPVLHLLGDRTLVIRVKNPRAVKIL